MSKKQVSVVIDSREPQAFTGHVNNHDEVSSWNISQLPAGDLAIEGVLFERKTPEDFAGSISGSTNIFDQAERMAEAADHAYVLIEGDMDDFSYLPHSNIREESIRGAMASITARTGVPVLCTSTPQGLVDMSVRLARKHWEGPSQNSIDTAMTPREADDVPAGMKMWACLPNIGPKVAERLYEEVGSPVALNGNRKNTLKRVDGVGEKRADGIIEALDG